MMILDIEQPSQLVRYLRECGHINANETPVLQVLPGGVSNRVVWVERENGEAWVMKQALEKLRVAADWFSSPQRVHREALGIRWLEKLAPRGSITPLVFEDHEHHLLAMRAVPQPHENWKVLLLAGHIERRHVEQFGTLLGAIHSNAFERRDEIAPFFDDRSFFEALRLEPYYAASAERAPQAAEFLHALIRDTRKRQLTLVQGDYSPKNVLVQGDHLVLLDHEVIHWGDPAFDAGFALTHLLSKAHHLAKHREQFAQAAALFWQCYRDRLETVSWADEMEIFTVRHALACLLARVVGRSPLEYLTQSERMHQQNAVMSLLIDVPQTVSALIEGFIERI